MDIVVNTKYNINDTVWFADYFYDTCYPCKYPAKISEINININESRLAAVYLLAIDYGDGITLEKCAEKFCFPTYEECTKWCEEQNKKIG